MTENGRLPRRELSRIYHPDYAVCLEKEAAAGWNTMRIWSKRFLKTDIYPLGENSAYRTYEKQEYYWNLYQSGQGNLAAVPGTSNHGWGKAVDLAATIMKTVIDRFGKKWGWAKIEAPSEWWHYNYVGGYNRPNPGYSVKYPIARKGSGGFGQKWFVKKLERRLRRLGYKAVKADGFFGPVTQEKVKNFQRLTGLKADGVVGKKTWVKLYEVNKKELKKLRQNDTKKNSKPIAKGTTNPSEMKISQKGLDFIKNFEGYSPKLVNIGDGVATIGYGYTQPLNSSVDKWLKNQIKPGYLTEPEASRLLEQEIASDYAPAIRKLFVKGGKLEGLFSQELFDALISFAWNLGSGFTTAPSGFETIQRNIKNRDINAIADCLVLYRSPGTIFEEGLKRRRLAEATLIKIKQYNNKYTK